MVTYQKKFKENIQYLINQNKLKEAKELLSEYEKIIKDDIEIYSIKSVIAIMEGNLEEAKNILLCGYSINKENFDILYNLGFIYQSYGENELAIKYYKQALQNSKTKNEAEEAYKMLQQLGVEEGKEELVNQDIGCKNVLYLGWLGKGNVGDDVLFELFKKMFYRYYIFAGKDFIVNIDAYPAIQNYKVDVSTYDLIVLGGGSLIHLPFYLQICEEGLKHGVPVVSWGTGIDGMFRREHLNLIKLPVQTVELFRSIYEKFDYISVRGPFTKNVLINSGLKKEIHEIGDPALFYSAETFGDLLEVDKKNVNKNILINWGTSYNNIFGRNEIAVEKELEKAIKLLISKGYTITIYPIWVEDIEPVKRLAQKINDDRCKVITEVYEARILHKLISQSYFTINLKLHANILSASANRPFISLAYRGKCFDFAETVNCSEFVLATDQVTSEKILKMADNIENNYDIIVARFRNAKEKYYPRIVNSIHIISKILRNKKLNRTIALNNTSQEEILRQKCHKFLSVISSKKNVDDLLKIQKEFIDNEINNLHKQYLETLLFIYIKYIERKISKSAFRFYLQKQFGIKENNIEKFLECSDPLKEEKLGKKGTYKISNNPSKVSVIITTYNRKDYLKESIDSILKQDYPNIDIIVIDDCSTDGTNILMKNYEKNSSVIYIRNEKNCGPGSNRKKAFENYANGDYILFLDDDDYLIDTNYITKAVDFHKKHAKISFVAANVFYEFSKNNILKPSICNLGEIINRYDYFINFGKKGFPKPASTLTTLFKRECLIKMGILDMKMVNDASIYLRSLLVGDAGFIDEIVGVYRIHGDNITFNLSSEFIIENLEEKLQIKNIAINQYGYDKKEMERWMDYNAYTTISYFLSNSAKDPEDINNILLWVKRNCPNLINKLRL